MTILPFDEKISEKFPKNEKIRRDPACAQFSDRLLRTLVRNRGIELLLVDKSS